MMHYANGDYTWNKREHQHRQCVLMSPNGDDDADDDDDDDDDNNNNNNKFVRPRWPYDMRPSARAKSTRVSL